jgi:hypothetical protein
MASTAPPSTPRSRAAMGIAAVIPELLSKVVFSRLIQAAT